MRDREEGEEGMGGGREGERERERNGNILLSIHSLVASYMCPEQASNLQPWHIRMNRVALTTQFIFLSSVYFAN